MPMDDLLTVWFWPNDVLHVAEWTVLVASSRCGGGAGDALFPYRTVHDYLYRCHILRC